MTFTSLFPRFLAFAAFVLALAGCAAPTPTDVAPLRPRLVVLLIVDGLPARQVEDYRAQLAPDGLARFLDRGAWFAEAHYGQSRTVTAVGHSIIATGAYPHRTGIIDNSWRDNTTGEVVYCAGDPEHTYVGHETPKLAGTSPKNLKVQTVGDVLRGVDSASRVIAISGKDRGAIFTAGRAGTAYIYQPSTGQFATTTYYMKEHWPWVKAFNAAKPADKYFNAEWKPLYPDDAYGKSLPDGQRWFAKGGRLPKRVAEGARPGPAFYADLRTFPFMDQLTLDFARAAVVGEGLGQDSSPDILAVSLSTHDFVNHAYGAESRISHDHVLHLDRALQEFFRFLDEKVGRENYAAVLTADHGMMPAPDYLAILGTLGGRFNTAQNVARLNRSLGRYGSGPFVRHITAYTASIERDIAARRGVPFDQLANDVRGLLLADSGVAAAYTRDELEGNTRVGQPYFEAIERSWNREVSGDVAFVLKPNWSSAGEAGTHGSPHPYDTHVPLLLYGPAWMSAGRRDARVEMVDLVPTIAQLLGIPPPPTAEGKPLPLR